MIASASSMLERLAALTAALEGPDAHAAVLASLEDSAPPVRERAIRHAARLVEPGVLLELVGRHDHAALRNAAIAALERQGPYATSHLVAMLWERRDPELLMFMLQMLARIGDRSASPAIEPLVGHSDPNVAQAAIEALGAVGAIEALPTLLDALRGDLWFQLAAVDALGKLGDRRAVPALLALVPTSLAAEAALHALAAIGDPSALTRLVLLLLEHPRAAYRDALLAATARTADHSPDGPGLPIELASLVTGDASAPIRAYLADALEDPADDAETVQRRRDAATLAMLAPIPPLLPAAFLAGAGTAWIEALCVIHPRPLEPHLLDLAAHQNPQVRAAALYHGRFHAADAAAVRGHLLDPEASVRAAACQALGRLSDTGAVPLLIERLRQGEPLEREAAVAALAQLPSRALAALADCLDPTVNEQVTTAALAALERASTPPPTLRLQGLARHGSPVVRRAALRVAALEGSGADQLLLHGLADVDATVQAEALDLLVQRGGDRAVTTLTALLAIADSLRFRVIRGLGQLRAGGAVRRLIHLYPDAFPHERVEIVGALGNIGSVEAREFLAERLRDPDLELRRAAVRGLAAWAGLDDLPLLRTLAADQDWNVRDAAARSLGRLGPAYARDTLLELARDVESVVAATARQALVGVALVSIVLQAP